MRTDGIVTRDTPSLVPQSGGVPLDPHRHSVQFYREDSFLLDELGCFIGDALREGNVGVVIATKTHRSGLAQKLQTSDLDLAQAVSEGRYIALDAFDTLSMFMRDGTPDLARFTTVIEGVLSPAWAKAKGKNPRIAAFGEMVALLCIEGKIDAAIQLEQFWNELDKKYSFELRCAYPLSLFCKMGDGDPLARICSEHSQVIPVESYPLDGNEEDQRRNILLLQQKAEALETEVEERKEAQETLERREVEMERALRECTIRAEAAVQARDRFLLIASHELRTPLTALKGSTQLLRRRQARGNLDEGQLRRALVVLDESANQLARLTNDLLDMSRIQTGQLELACCEVDFRALVSRAVDRADNVAEHDGRLAACLPGEPAIVWGDADRLDQVLTNLLDNARRNSSRAGSIVVRLESAADEGWLLSVHDRGIGISPDALDIIFEPFAWALNAAANHLPGLGLGLYISRTIVELHRGRIWAESAGEGMGSIFYVWLPGCSTRFATHVAR